MHSDSPALRVQSLLQVVQAGPGHGVLHVRPVLRPGQHHLPRRGEGADVVHMLVGLVIVDAPGQPEDLRYVQIRPQHLLNLFPGKRRIPPSAQQAALRHHAGSLPVHMDGAALQDEVPLAVHILLQQVAELPRHLVVLVPGEVQAVVEASPGVEAPVYASYDTCVVFYKGGCVVPGPGVIAGHLHHPDMGGEQGSGIVVLGPAGADRHLLRPGDGLGHLREGPSGRVSAVLPGVRPLREYQDAALMGLELRGHPEAVRGRSGSFDDFHELTLSGKKFLNFFNYFFYNSLSPRSNFRHIFRV